MYVHKHQFALRYVCVLGSKGNNSNMKANSERRFEVSTLINTEERPPYGGPS